jgi:hypothetical protein
MHTSVTSTELTVGPRVLARRWDGIVRVAIAVVAILLIIGGVTCFVASFLPFSFAQAQISGFGGMRGSTSVVFSDAVFRGLVQRARIGGAVLLAAALAVILVRHALYAYSLEMLCDYPVFVSDVARRARQFILGEERPHLLAVVFVSVCGALLRLAFLFQPIRYDEANTFLGSASAPLYIGLSKYLNNNNHLLNTLLTHFSFLLFGDAP